MQRPDGSGGGQPAGMTIGSILRMALKAYAGGGLSGGGASATGSDFGANGGLVGAVGPEAANSITAVGDTGGSSFANFGNSLAKAALNKSGGGNQQFSADRTTQDLANKYYPGFTPPMLKFNDPYQQGY